MERNNRKILDGVVVSDKMNKTVVVKALRKVRHPKYEKLVELRKKYYAHCEENNFKVGQKVRIMETRPLSKLKKWRVLEAL